MLTMGPWGHAARADTARAHANKDTRTHTLALGGASVLTADTRAHTHAIAPKGAASCTATHRHTRTHAHARAHTQARTRTHARAQVNGTAAFSDMTVRAPAGARYQLSFVRAPHALTRQPQYARARTGQRRRG